MSLLRCLEHFHNSEKVKTFLLKFESISMSLSEISAKTLNRSTGMSEYDKGLEK
jgi:hypothetical protein